jgi:tetraacyldisaccharide 4'-kinase
MLYAWLTEAWYRRRLPPLWLIPFSWLFGWVVQLRRALYRLHFMQSTTLPVPVVVVGNITVGGTGKTPLTLGLVTALKARGWHPGIVSRGYGSTLAGVSVVTPQDDPRRVGDEPVLMARHSGVPVWVGRDRVAAAQELLATHPEVDVLLSDDGLQHLALNRDMEIVVMDGARGLGNGALLPAGPLREPATRLRQADAVVVNGMLMRPLVKGPLLYRLGLQGTQWVNVCNPTETKPLQAFSGSTCHALAGIGNPQRFFDTLAGLGVKPVCHAFPDHHPFSAEDLVFAEHQPILMTEKDGIKCTRFAGPEVWMLQITPVVDVALLDLMEHLIRRRLRGRQAA